MTREQDRKKMFDFMIQEGANEFWATSAMRHIMGAFAGNTYWLTNIKNPAIVIGEFGMVDKFTVDCIINIESDKTNGTLTYEFDRGHKVRVKAA